MRRSILLVLALLFFVWAIRAQAQISQGSSITGSGGSSAPTATPTNSPTPTQTPTPTALVAQGGQIINGGGVGIGFNTSFFMPYSGTNSTGVVFSTENNVRTPASGVYTVKNLYCLCQGAIGGGTPGDTVTFVFTDTTGGTFADTALKCSSATGGGTPSCNDTSDSFTTTVGHDYAIRLQVSPGATPTSTWAAGTCTCSVGP